MSFKTPLKSRDRFLSVLTDVRREGIRYRFSQKIYRLPDMKLCNMANTDCVVVINGVLSSSCEAVDRLMASLQK